MAFALRSTATQQEFLAALLQDGSVWDIAPDLWCSSLFDESEHLEIFRAYERARALNKAHPSETAIVDTLLGSNPVLPLEIAKADVLKELMALYKLPLNNLEYTISRMRSAAKVGHVVRLLDEGVSHISSAADDTTAEGALSKVHEMVHKMNQIITLGESVSDLKDADYFTLRVPPRRVVIPNFLMSGCVGMLSAKSKMGKTWVLLAAAIAVAAGKSWLGFKPCQPGRSLYVGFELIDESPEDGEGMGLQERIWTIARKMDVNPADLVDRFDVLNRKGYPNNSIDAVINRIRSIYRKEDPWDLIIVDPLYHLYSTVADSDENVENNNTYLRKVFAKFETLAKEIGSAFLVAHHFKKGKNDGDPMDAGSGGGTLSRAPDTMLNFKDIADEDAAWICHPKARYFPPTPSFAVRWEFPLLIRDPLLDDAPEEGAAGAKKKFTVMDVIAILPAIGATSKDWKDRATADLGCGETTFRALKKLALEDGMIEADGDHGYKTIFKPTELVSKELLKHKSISALKGFRANGRFGKSSESV